MLTRLPAPTTQPANEMRLYFGRYQARQCSRQVTSNWLKKHKRLVQKETSSRSNPTKRKLWTARSILYLIQVSSVVTEMGSSCNLMSCICLYTIYTWLSLSLDLQTYANLTGLDTPELQSVWIYPSGVLRTQNFLFQSCKQLSRTSQS